MSETSVTVVSPVFNEESGIGRFVEEVEKAFSEVGLESWSLLLIDDGSQDQSLEIIRMLAASRPEVEFVSLSRNFGHQAALTAGLDQARGDVVIVIDSDLQDPPSLIPEMLRSWEDGKDVVFGKRLDRSESGLRRLGLDLFHRLFRYCIDFPIPKNVGVFALMDRRAVDELVKLEERNRFLPGLQTWVGFERGFVEYRRGDREAGEPKQTFSALCKYAVDGVLSFSYKPVRLLGVFGTLVALGAFALALYFSIKRLLGYEIAFTGFTTLVILLCFFGGLILMALGLIGVYVARIYDEVKGRPLYIIRESSLSDE